MAYAAVISLKQTINSLVNSSRISLASSTREILDFAYNETTYLQKILEIWNDINRRSSSERLDDLEGQIRDCANQLEDVVEIYESNLLTERYEDDGEVRQEISSFAERVKKMETEYIEELFKPVVPQIFDVSSNIDFGVEMVGRSTEFTKFKKLLLERKRPADMFVLPLVGESGTGVSVIAKTIFEDLQQSFDCGAFVRVGPIYGAKEVLIRILAQLDNLAALDDQLLMSREDEKIRNYVYNTLKHRRYMIVLEDVPDVQLFDYLKTSFPDQSDGGLVFLTTSLMEVAKSAKTLGTYKMYTSYFQNLGLFILRNAMFKAELISPEFEEAAEKIAENCGGRFISLAKTLLFLSKTEKTVEQWSKIAADKENPIFVIGDEASEIREIKTEMQSYNGVLEDWGISSLIDFSGVIEELKRMISPERLFSRMEIISFVGMAGIGKSSFVKNLFKYEAILYYFDCHAWVTLGPNYQADEILIDILAQFYPGIDKLHMKGDEKLATDLCAQLYEKRCLIVLDDLWSREPLLLLKKLFPDIRGISMVTTRLANVATFGKDDILHEMELLNEEESWCLLREKVFAEGLCPAELEKAGRKIAKNCDGLPLLILTVADQLLKVEMTAEHWNDVASREQNIVFKNAHDQISKALLPSYESLPQHLKAFFLYMGVFRKSYVISKPQLTNLCIAEGFLEPNQSQIEEDFVAECLSELVDSNLVMVQQKAFDFKSKACRLHSVFWHLSNSVAEKNKCFHAMNVYADCSIACIKRERRLCIRNNTLLGIKDVQNSMASNTSAHSLLCVGPPQQYPVPLNFDLRLLRVMNALTVRLYEFPVEVVKLVHLRYLGLTCKGNLPSSISNLWKLQYLIVRQYWNININTKSSTESLLLPVEIWDMKELKHLQIMGGRLPNPKSARGATGLLKLSTLLDVSAQSCTKKVLKRIPNLKRLGIRIELAPEDNGKHPFRCLNRISRLRRLESLKCVVVNPQMGSEVVAPPPAPISMFPSSLKRLSLSGFGYPWEHMSIINKLENLRVLKLKRYAFQGAKWDVDYTSPFRKLKFFLLEDTNLVHWGVKSPFLFDHLELLSIKHCYKLHELPLLSCKRVKVEIVDCNPLIMTWVEQTRQLYTCEVQSSWIATSHEE